MVFGVIAYRFTRAIRVGGLTQASIGVIVIMRCAAQRINGVAWLSYVVVRHPDICAVRINEFGETVIRIVLVLCSQRFYYAVRARPLDALCEFVPIRVIREACNIAKGIRFLREEAFSIVLIGCYGAG